jgi:hypothetical protein
LALILPKTVLSGSSWELTRQIFDNYCLKYVIVSHEPNNWNFSESVEFSEVLLILNKRLPLESDYTLYVNIWTQPRTTVEALSLINSLNNRTPANIDAPSGICEIRTNGTKYGEMLRVPVQHDATIPWSLAANFAQTDLCRVAYNLNRSNVVLPSIGQVGQIPTTILSNRATLGPDGRDVYDGFSLTDTRTTYTAFWGHNAETCNTVEQLPNQYLAPLTQAPNGRNLRDATTLWRRAGTLMLAKELWLSTNSITGIVLANPSLSNVWWPTRWTSDDPEIRSSMERRLALWFNSTLGVLTMLMQRQETKGPWVKFPKNWYETLRIIDLNALTDEQLHRLDETYQSVCRTSLLPFPMICEDNVRIEIDDSFSDILGLSHLDLIRELLAREPIVSMQPL